MRLKPRRKIWVTRHCLLLGRVFADQVAHDRAGADANADTQGGADNYWRPATAWTSGP
jgi:hypothetical protein